MPDLISAETLLETVANTKDCPLLKELFFKNEEIGVFELVNHVQPTE